MIVTTTQCVCDKCNLPIGVDGYFTLNTKKTPLTVQTYATNYPICNDGIAISFFDEYPSYHLCQECLTKVQQFIKNLN